MKRIFIDTNVLVDLEDGFQYFTAKENNIKVIITRNEKDFEVNDVSVVSPKQFLAAF